MLLRNVCHAKKRFIARIFYKSVITRAEFDLFLTNCVNEPTLKKIPISEHETKAAFWDWINDLLKEIIWAEQIRRFPKRIRAERAVSAAGKDNLRFLTIWK